MNDLLFVVAQNLMMMLHLLMMQVVPQLKKNLMKLLKDDVVWRRKDLMEELKALV
jgi:hypothetical protein